MNIKTLQPASKFGHKIKRAILDFDNTIASWTDYAIPAYLNMATALSRATGIDIEMITLEMRKVYDKQKTIEYAPLVQEMEIFQNRKDLDELVRIAKTAFSQTKRKHLKLYPGIKELLETLRANGIKIYILTDAPYIQAAKRAERLKISHWIDGLIGLESPPAEKIHPRYRKAKLEFPFKTIVSQKEKPHTDFMEVMMQICNEPLTLEEIKATTIMIGDNPLKDGLLMQKWGLTGYLAEYGKASDDAHQQLLPFLPPSLIHRSMSSDHQTKDIIDIDLDHQIKVVYSVEEIIEDLQKADFINHKWA